MISFCKEDNNLQEACRRIKSGDRNIHVTGLWGGARALFVLALRALVPNPVMVISEKEMDSEMFMEDLRALSGDEAVLNSFWQDYPAESILSLASLASGRGKAGLLLTTISSIQSTIMPQSEFKEKSFEISQGSVVDYYGLAEKLANAGYEKTEMVSCPGEFSTRGEIFDIWPTGQKLPARLGFSFDSVENLKLFDPVTQKSGTVTEKLCIIPARLDSQEGEETLLFEWVGKDTVVVLDNISSHSVMGGLNLKDCFNKDENPVNFVEMAILPVKDSLKYRTFQQVTYNGDVGRFSKQLAEWHAGGLETHIFCNNSGEKSRLIELLNEQGHNPAVPGVFFEIGPLNAGFVCADRKLSVITDAEVFNRYRLKRRRNNTYSGAGLIEFSELKNGDFMVHERYGIGIYLGLKQMKVDTRLADYIMLEYTKKDRLYVPIEDFKLVQKYIGVEGQNPRLSSLDSTSWSQVKKKVRKSVKDIARELLDVYAARQELPGNSYHASHYEQEFIESFVYELTPMQEKAINDVMEDMERTRPMDRIVCGDVGYGKTEVAMRATLRAVLGGKQVAVLVPTTILAEQHFNTFTERFADYPVKIEMLSRFRNKKQQEEIIKTLREGSLDVVIGTHRLLQKDIAIADLGLVVIDEEHRFGVTHKEKLKQLRKLVDVLTLTATPIPRTLSMSMGGVRDLSVIDTPPPQRLPVETYVGEYDDETIKLAILNEVNRGGQVFYIHDRVDTMESVIKRLGLLLPGIKMGHAHGRMPAKALEKVMKDFIKGKFDLLVSTTIVESGIDIHSANTLIVSNAQKLGMAQMHQLRGRIGRDKYQAFCYLLYPREMPLTDIAKKRLNSLAQHTDLGAGFKIAIKDLEIRGAGNLLGSQQHGQMMDVGFDLYCKLLGQAVEETRSGREPLPEVEEAIEIDLPLDAYIPASYIQSSPQRITAYRRLSWAEDRKGIDELAAELVDRYGKVPPACSALFEIVELRQLSKLLGVTEIHQQGGGVVMEFSDYRKIKPQKMSGLGEGGAVIKLGNGNCFSVVLENVFADSMDIAIKVKNLLQGLL